MSMEPDHLQVRGPEIVNGRGEVIRLRGFCLGGWMNMENFITGYPGHESGFRAEVARVLGEEKARLFFDRFLHYFIGEDDLRFLKELGCNAIRIPLNYRHFESDERPFQYNPGGFELLDKVIGRASAERLYVILDLHAVQGWQNGGWHSDNPCGVAHFWGQRVFEDRAIGLWQELARRYRGEPFVAGYDVMNEPRAPEARLLNDFYRRVTNAIRAVDPDHILFLEGNRDSQLFDELDPPFDRNTAYSSHNYVLPGLDDGEYPGAFGGEFYDREQLQRGYLTRTAFMRQHAVPHWFGEFGCIFSDDRREVSRLRVMADLIDIAEEQGDHWTIWTFKDIGNMGMVCVDPGSDWMERTRPVREAKTALRCDNWIERSLTNIDPAIDRIAEYAAAATYDRIGNLAEVGERLRWAICGGALSQMLMPAFAEQFRGMSENEIDLMMQSFAFKNCIPRRGLVELLREVLPRDK